MQATSYWQIPTYTFAAGRCWARRRSVSWQPRSDARRSALTRRCQVVWERADRSRSDTVRGRRPVPVGFPEWNRGNHNYLAYTMAGVPGRCLLSGPAGQSGTITGSGTPAVVTRTSHPKKGHEFPPCWGSPTTSRTPTPITNMGQHHLDWPIAVFIRAVARRLGATSITS